MSKVSVAFATYKERPEYLRESLVSVLRQTYTNFEILISVEPDDPNRLLLQEFAHQDERVKLIYSDFKLGLSGSLNNSIKHAAGEFISRMDSDDVAEYTRFEKQVAFLNANPAVDLVGSAIKIIDEKGAVYASRSYPPMHRQILRRFIFSCGLAHPSIMLRKTVFLDQGLYDSNFKYSEDIELWLRFLAGGKVFANLGEPLLWYRVSRSAPMIRSREHWSFNLEARKRYCPKIWPIPVCWVAVFIAFLISHFPKNLTKVRALSYLGKMFIGVSRHGD